MERYQDNQAGSSLSYLRERRGITLREIAESTKINPWYLRAIELGEFERLPGGVYDVNYIRQYAEAVDCDADELLAAYRAATAPPPAPAPELESGPGSRVRRLILAVEALVSGRAQKEAPERG